MGLGNKQQRRQGFADHFHNYLKHTVISHVMTSMSVLKEK